MYVAFEVDCRIECMTCGGTLIVAHATKRDIEVFRVRPCVRCAEAVLGAEPDAEGVVTPELPVKAETAE